MLSALTIRSASAPSWTTFRDCQEDPGDDRNLTEPTTIFDGISFAAVRASGRPTIGGHVPVGMLILSRPTPAGPDSRQFPEND